MTFVIGFGIFAIFCLIASGALMEKSPAETFLAFGLGMFCYIMSVIVLIDVKNSDARENLSAEQTKRAIEIRCGKYNDRTGKIMLDENIRYIISGNVIKEKK